jgi:hypothetical protein
MSPDPASETAEYAVPPMTQPDGAAEPDAARDHAGIPASPAAAAPESSQAPPLPGGATKRPWKSAADGNAVFRRGTPLVLWWLWVAFAVFNIIDVAVPDHDYFSFELSAGLLGVTAVVYACALRPRVVADDDAIYVYNPYRDHVVRWGAVKGVHLGDSVELTCARLTPRKDKIIYCWALYSGRRARLRTQLRAERQQARLTRQTASDVGDLRQPDPVKLMAAELGRRSAGARQRGAKQAALESRWAWLPLAYLAVPAAALLALILAR